MESKSLSARDVQLKEHIRRIETESYRSLAKRLGISVDYLVKNNMELINAVLSTDESKVSAEASKHFPLKDEEDYWNFVHERYGMAKKIHVQMICDYLKRHSVIFDVKAVSIMSEALGINKRAGGFSIDFLESFMGVIPIVVLYDLEFNAQTARGFIFKNMPVIRVFDFLFQNMHILLRYLCVLAFEEVEDGFRYRSGFTDPRSGYFRLVTHQIDKIIVLCTGMVPVLKYRFGPLLMKPPWPIKLLSRVLDDVTSSFVWIHEFGHILFGDVMQKEWRRDMEFRCDTFAAECLFDSPRYAALPDSLGRPLVLLGSDILFIILRTVASLTRTGEVDMNLWQGLNERGKRISENLRNRLTEQEKKRYYYFINLLMPLILPSESSRS